MADSSSSLLTPEDQAYFDQERQQAGDTKSIGLAENASQKSASDLSYQQKLQALTEQLTQQQNALPDDYAARGLMNSGIWSYGGSTRAQGGAQQLYSNYAGVPGGQMGALQQFLSDKGTSETDVTAQQRAADAEFNQKATDLGTAYNASMAGIQSTEAEYAAQQAAADAIAGV